MTKREHAGGGLVAVLVGTAAGLRLAGLNSELWFDEIVSVGPATALPTLTRLFTTDHTDNKHHLSWAWAWLAGPGRPEWAYRLPSYAAGVAVVPLLYAVVRRPFGRGAGLLAGVLAAFCYPLIFYSTEARGYALAVLFATAAYALAPDPAGPTPRRRAAAFGTCVVAGFLSHLTFAYAYAGLLAWAAVDVARRPRWVKAVAAYHGPGAAVLAAVWWVDWSHLQMAGGPPTTAAVVLRYLAALTVPVPAEGVWPWVAVAAAVALCGVGITVVARRQGPGRAAFFVVAVAVVPAVLTATRRTPYLAPRYYLVAVPFAIVLVAAALTTINRYLALGVTAAVVVQGVVGTLQLQSLGRGHVREALSDMAAADAGGGPITYGSERRLMDGFDIGYYAASVPGRRAVTDATDAPRPPRWWILDLDDPLDRGPDTIRRHGRVYRLQDRAYPSVATSGLTWDLYRLVPE